MNNAWIYLKNIFKAAFTESVRVDCNTSMQMDRIKRDASAKPVAYGPK